MLDTIDVDHLLFEGVLGPAKHGGLVFTKEDSMKVDKGDHLLVVLAVEERVERLLSVTLLSQADRILLSIFLPLRELGPVEGHRLGLLLDLDSLIDVNVLWTLKYVRFP